MNSLRGATSEPISISNTRAGSAPAPDPSQVVHATHGPDRSAGAHYGCAPCRTGTSARRTPRVRRRCPPRGRPAGVGLGRGRGREVGAARGARAASTPDARWSWGACDGLFTPRPLGPLLDIAGSLGGELAETLAGGRPREADLPGAADRGGGLHAVRRARRRGRALGGRGHARPPALRRSPDPTYVGPDRGHLSRRRGAAPASVAPLPGPPLHRAQHEAGRRPAADPVGCPQAGTWVRPGARGPAPPHRWQPLLSDRAPPQCQPRQPPHVGARRRARTRRDTLEASSAGAGDRRAARHAARPRAPGHLGVPLRGEPRRARQLGSCRGRRSRPPLPARDHQAGRPGDGAATP